MRLCGESSRATLPTSTSPPLPPPLPRSSLWLGIQRPCNYPDAEVRPFLVACEEGALGEVGRFVREEKAVLRQIGLQDGLACAAQGTQVRVARYLLEEGGAFLHGAVVEAACRARCLPLFELCVRHGYHPDQQMRGGLGVALNHCLGRGQEDIARFLLQNGASPDLARFHDNRMACWGGRRSAPPLDRTAGLALDLAAEKGSLSTVRMLLEHGANANYARQLERAVRRRAAQPDEDDWRPLMEMLMRHGADVNAVTYRGGTALTAAVSRGMADVVDFLLEHGADPRVRKPVTQRDAFAIAAAGAGVAWEETEEAAEYLARLCDAETILHRGDAALVPDEVRRNPLVLSLERIKMRRQGEAGE